MSEGGLDPGSEHLKQHAPGARTVVWFDRRTCLLLSHSATLFTIFEAGVKPGEVRQA